MGWFDGKVAVVTGAGGGLGRAHALLLAAEGAQVVVNDYGGDSHGTRGDSAMAAAVVDEIVAAGGEAVADSSDVALEGAQVIQTALDAFGAIHLLINNAGIAGGGTIETIPADEFDRMVAIHLGGTIAVSRAAWPYLREQGYGRIVNTSSSSVFGLPGTPSYITAKAGIFGLTRALALDGRAIGVTVNAVMPSAYSRLTAQSPDFAPVMEAGFPPELASPFVCSLLTEQVPCNGETFVVGGGRAARVVLATAPGLREATTIDACLDRFDEAMAVDDLYIPEDAVHQVVYECRQVGIDIGALTGD